MRSPGRPETARHEGHLDLLREQLDGSRGFLTPRTMNCRRHPQRALGRPPGEEADPSMFPW
ncbi:hypothetical protein DDE18_19485 [Nocardioides gansuensis]|uniref:DUF664 domain-containing protein n=1 Tax=Nocardioides gansuensis TaxID=2138300 RepID=A0A2T8F624_9ACTN|nr:hypothetical protein DDE18_19485 [Nocardioides gansuensis]